MYILAIASTSRFACYSVVNALRVADQRDVAEVIDSFNKSSGNWELTFQELLVVKSTLHPKNDLYSNCYDMSFPVRGHCFIVNNVEEAISPNEVGLSKETNRFRQLFQDLHFNVITMTPKDEMNCQRLENMLETFSKSDDRHKDQAFVMIMISHGSNNQILGYEACKAYRDWNFGREQESVVKEKIDKDVTDIEKIYNIFSEKNCPKLMKKPKLFFFICCRCDDSNVKSRGIVLHR